MSVVIAFSGWAQTIAGKPRTLSVDEMMRMEGIDSGLIEPNGRWLLVNRQRPYEQFDDFSFSNYAMAKSGHQIWRYDLKSGKDLELLPGLDPAPSSYLEGFSPSGRFLAILQYHFGVLSLASYDMKRQHAVQFQATPSFSKDGAYSPLWASDSEMIFPALPVGEQPIYTGIRAQTGRVLTKAWEDAWHGKVVTANEVQSPAKDQSSDPEPGRLVRVNAANGKVEVLADGLYTDLRVSPDHGSLVALSVSKPRPTDPAKLAEDDPRRYHLAIFDLKSGKKKMLVPELEFFPYSIAWASDSKRIVAYGWKPEASPRQGRFFMINVDTGSIVRYEHTGLDLASERERGWYERPERTVILGNSLAVFARRIPANEDQTPRFTYQNVRPVNLSKPDWYLLAPDGSSRNLTSHLAGVSAVPIHATNNSVTVIANDGVYRLYDNGTSQRITPKLDGRFQFEPFGTINAYSDVARSEFGNEGLFNVRGEGQAKIVLVELREGHEEKVVVVSAPSTNALPLAGSLRAGTVLFRAEDGPISRLLLARASAEEKPREILNINSHLADVDMGTWKVVAYEVKDPTGKQPPQKIESCVLLPPGYSKEAPPPPLVVEVYPNTRPRCKDNAEKVSLYTLSWSPYLWAGKGYAYAELTTPRALINTPDSPIAGMPNVVNAGVDALVKSGFADPQRLALVGFSQGGDSALYTAAYSARFKAVIAMNSWADLFSHYFGANGIYSTVYGEDFGSFSRYDSTAGSDFGFGKTPFEVPDQYYRNSPVFLAPKITAPVLLIHSDMDSFSMSQFDEMYAALLRAGKDVRYVRYWGEGHGPSSPANIRDLWKRIESFLAENGMVSQRK